MQESIASNIFRKFYLTMNAVKCLTALRNEPQVGSFIVKSPTDDKTAAGWSRSYFYGNQKL